MADYIFWEGRGSQTKVVALRMVNGGLFQGELCVEVACIMAQTLQDDSSVKMR